MPPRRKLRPSTAPSKPGRFPMLPASPSTPQHSQIADSIHPVPPDSLGKSHTDEEFAENSDYLILPGSSLQSHRPNSPSSKGDLSLTQAGLPTSGPVWPYSSLVEDVDSRDWPSFIRAYAAGQWDPYRTPIPPRPSTFSPRSGSDADWSTMQSLIGSTPPRTYWSGQPQPPSIEAQVFGSSIREPSIILDGSAVSTATNTPTGAADSRPTSPDSSSTTLVVSPTSNLHYPIADPSGVPSNVSRPRSPNSVTTIGTLNSIARRRGTDPPDLRGPVINIVQSTPPAVPNPTRPILSTSSSDPPPTPPAFGPPSHPPTPHVPGSYKIENTTAAATVRWAGAGVTVAPLSLPSPEYELTDPMRKLALGPPTTAGQSSTSRSLEITSQSRETLRHPILSSSAPARVFTASRTVSYTPPSRLESITASPQGSPGESPPTMPNIANIPEQTGQESKDKAPTQRISAFADYSHGGQAGDRGAPNTAAMSAPLQPPRRVAEGGDYFGGSPAAKGPAHSASQPSRTSQVAQFNDQSSFQAAALPVPRPRTPNPPKPSQAPLLASIDVTTHSRSDSGGSAIGLGPRSLSMSVPHGTAPPCTTIVVSHDQNRNASGSEMGRHGMKINRLGPTDFPHYDSPEASYAHLGWLRPPLPPDEMERSKALNKFNILFTARDVNFERIAHLAKLVFNTKMVVVSLIDGHTQFHKAEAGVNANIADRAISFCGHTILQRGDEPMVILDASKDWRFANNPLVVGGPMIRFYAGAPLRTAEGYNVGSLCVIDDQARTELTPRQRHTLKEFAAIVMREMELWRDKIQLRIRDRIQTSMEQFTRECLELNVPESQKSTTGNLDKVYQMAATLVQRTLDVEGALVLDVSHFEAVETLNSDGTTSVVYHADLYEGGMASSTQSAHSSSRRGHASLSEGRGHDFGPIPDLKILGSAEVNPPNTRGSMISGEDHAQISRFLSNSVDGKIFERLPSCFRHLVPHDILYAMIVPVFDTNGIPFALLCAYTSKWSMHYLEGFELQYLRAIGVIILSAVLKRRMYLADNSKSLFISNISHELRTPLHGILASAELLAETRLTPTQSSYLQVVQACGTSLVETVNHVLDFTKLSGNVQRDSAGAENPVRPVKFDLAQLVDETVEGCWIGAKAKAVYGSSDIGSMYNPPKHSTPVSDAVAENRHVETVVDIGYRAAGWGVRTDRAGVRRLLINLISNSMKFTNNGFILITLRDLPNEATNRVRFELAVSDTGKGISPDFIQNRLFQPFSQENPLQSGTGLGLAIVNTIVKSLHGQVNVASAEQEGTEIRVSIDVEALPTEVEPRSMLDAPLVDEHRTVSVSIIDLDSDVKGLKVLGDVLRKYLSDWWGLKVLSEDDEVLGDIIVLHEDYDFIKELVTKREISRPIILISPARGNHQLMAVVGEFERLGGSCKIVFKPCSPIRLKEACRAAIKMLDGHHFTPPSPTSPFTPTYRSSRPRQTAREYNMADGEDERSSDANADESAYESAYGTPSPRPPEEWKYPSGPLLPQALLTRRRSEETREYFPTRPPMAPRSQTYHSSHPREENGVDPLATDVDDLVPPGSPTSTYSLADGGSVMLKSAAHSLDTSSGKRSVLLVDDNALNRKLLAQWLRKRGYPFKEAVDGQDAVEIFQSHPPGYFDVLLLDLSMPRLNGFEAGAAIRNIEASRNRLAPDNIHRSKIFALTGLASIDDKRRAFTIGVDGYLIKPVSFKTLEGVFSRLDGLTS